MVWGTWPNIKWPDDKVGRTAPEQAVDTQLCTGQGEMNGPSPKLVSLLCHPNVEIVFVTQLSRQPIVFLILASL